jgi:ABC-type transport system involved in multi-copper enzyme maturation permease subunit
VTAILAIARLTWLRLRRGRTIWISFLLLCVPLALAGMSVLRVEDPWERWWHTAELTLRSLVLLAPVVHLAPVVSDELEGRTYTYLWSRPIPRSSLLFGKMLAVTPALMLVSAAAVVAAWAISERGQGFTPVAWLWPALAAVTTGVIGSSCFAIGVGAIYPRQPLAVAVGWVLFFEQVFPAIPTLQHLSTLFHTQVIAGIPHEFIKKADTSVPRSLLSLAVLSTIWLALAVWRIRKAELSSADS